MVNFKDAHLKTAGAYISIEGLYPFAIGWKLHHGNIPVVRLGGHVEGRETGWECALREAAEEASIRIRPMIANTTFWVSAENHNLDRHAILDLQKIQWDPAGEAGVNPLLVVAYDIESNPSLSLMYLAESDDIPTPSAEVKGILLLDPESIDQICQSSMTLSQYLQRGGRAIFNDDFDQSLILEPFIQLRIFSQLLKAQLV